MKGIWDDSVPYQHSLSCGRDSGQFGSVILDSRSDNRPNSTKTHETLHCENDDLNNESSVCVCVCGLDQNKTGVIRLSVPGRMF